MPLQNDRRTIPRRDLRIKVLLKRADGSLVRGASVNISLSGMLFESMEKLTLGEEVQAHFFLPVPKDMLVCVGDVRWILPLKDSNYAGISFTGLGQDELFHLNSLGI